MGPWSYAKHLVSGSRLPFTAAYFGSIALTLYFAIGVRKSFFLSSLLSIIFQYPKHPHTLIHPPFQRRTSLSKVGYTAPSGKGGILHLQRSILQYDVTWLVTPALQD